jgi:hypothetical protein
VSLMCTECEYLLFVVFVLINCSRHLYSVESRVEQKV